MEDIKIPYDVMFGLWLNKLKDLPITYEYTQADDNKYYCFADCLNVHGIGDTLSEAVDDMLDALEEWAEIYITDLEDYFSHNPDDFPLVLKLRISTRKDLVSCLAGRRYYGSN